MPKPIINLKKVQAENLTQNLAFESKSSFKSNSPELVLRRKRSQNYVNILKKLDIAGHNISQDKINEIINAIKNELPELSIDEFPIGIVAKCYLGEPYEVHTLSMLGKSIVEHYKIGQSLPEGLEKARNLANNENYEFVEVYHNKIIAIKEDGSTAIIEDKQ